MPDTLLFAPPQSRAHRTPHGHPERRERFEAVLPLLERGGVALYYHPDRLDPSEVEDITKASESAIRAGRRLALIPHQGIADDALVVSAWRHQLRIQEFMQATTMEQIGDFVTFFDGLYELETRR